MKVDEVEAVVLAQMSKAQLRTAEAARVEIFELEEVSLSEFAGVGLDTNILKQLRRDPLLADSLTAKLRKINVPLIVPGQCVIEFWNNHKVFAKDDWAKINGDVTKLRTRLAAMGAISVADERIRNIESIIAEITQDLQESTAPDFLQSSQKVMDTILESAIQPMVSRIAFSQLATARQSCKVPPGFADEAGKGPAGLGDFFAWCDFILGVMSITPIAAAESKFLFVTDDSKPDWKTGGSGHPELVHEFRRITGGVLLVAGIDDFRKIVKR